MTYVRPGERIVVTGATGFVGSVLVQQLARSGYAVAGISTSGAPPSTLNSYLHDYYSADLTNGWPAISAFDGVVHLAGLAAVGRSFDMPQQYIEINSAIVTNLCESLLAMRWSGRAVVVSSGAVYGASQRGRGLSEDCPVSVTSPYVISKLLVETQCEYYRRRGVDILVARPFNHIGPGQGLGFIVPDLTQKVEAAITTGSAVQAGNLYSSRDYTDVRDVALAYERLLRVPEPRYSCYNICSGVTHSGWDILAAICAALGVVEPPVRSDITRSMDPSSVVGDHGRVRSEMGWCPTIDFQTSIADYLESRTDSELA